ncbi:hypothetical protein BDV98DRAFT_296792 [Pterulicium gracile]|uniref:Uncharacterized protein n=1 Tax=Pterulicium gracile TaxID=1884261 RepID=A0A5C3Q4Z0_9AGAR|nr:hypothetical protein BDV98DRAFT_296792 [Pterula gracilis]
MEKRGDAAVTDVLDAESAVDSASLKEIMSATYEGTRKGKGKRVLDTSLPEVNGENEEIRGCMAEDAEEGIQFDHEQSDATGPSPPYVDITRCGICYEAVQLAYSPVSSAQRPACSSQTHFGLKLPCPNSHVYCGNCLERYIRDKVDPNGDGQGTLRLECAE